MANNTIDTIAFVSKNNTNGVQDLYNTMIEVIKEYNEQGRISLKDVISKLGIKQYKTFYGATYIDAVNLENDVLYIYSNSRGVPSLVDIEILSTLFEIDYYIKSGSMYNDYCINTDKFGRVFPKTYSFDFKGKLDDIAGYFEDENDAIMIIYSGLTFGDAQEIFTYFRNVFGRFIPYDVLNDDEKLETYMAGINWIKTKEVDQFNLYEEQLTYIQDLLT